MFSITNTVVWRRSAFPLHTPPSNRFATQNNAKYAPAEIPRKRLIEIVIGKIFRRGFKRTFERCDMQISVKKVCLKMSMKKILSL